MSATAIFSPTTASTGEPAKLAMQRLWLTGRILPVGARLWVRHEFRSAEARPVEVVYCFGLPRDAALRRFRVSGVGFEIHSELRRTAEAVKEYEKGIESGSLSTLARQYGDGLVNLTVGNIRPDEDVVVLLEILAGVDMRDDGLRFRFPFTLAPGYHSQARAVLLSPGEGEIELPSDPFGDVILPRFMASADRLHQVGFSLEVETGGSVGEVASPSHGIRYRQQAPGRAVVELAPASDVPNRDLVLDVGHATPGARVLAGPDAGGKTQFAAVIPSTTFGENAGAARRVVLLLDCSASMDGRPMDQARRAIEACLAALDAGDEFGLVAFNDRVEIFRPEPVPATREMRDRAEEFLGKVAPRGGTELAAGVGAAARVLGGNGDIMILTDGEVFGTEAILAYARASGARLHCLGIGAASQDRFLALLAEQTGGVSRFLTPRERVDRAALDLFAAIGRPVAGDASVRLAGRTEPLEPPRVIYAGKPMVVFGEALDGAVSLDVRWAGGSILLPLPDSNPALGTTLRLLRGARLLTDLDARYNPTPADAAARREAGRVKERLRALSEEYGLASREMSLVAVIRRDGDVAGEIPKTRVVAVGMAQDTTFPAYFDASDMVYSLCSIPDAASPPKNAIVSRLRGSRGFLSAAIPTDPLVALAARLEPDGGLSGSTEIRRVVNSLVALLAMLEDAAEAFREHVRKLLVFLDQAPLEGPRRALVEAVQRLARSGVVPSGDWRKHAENLTARGKVNEQAFWKTLEKAVEKARALTGRPS